MTSEPNAEKVELDKRRHAKIFIHFAKMFVELPPDIDPALAPVIKI
jgi:hypothetical protein